jgi:hypothetical protein
VTRRRESCGALDKAPPADASLLPNVLNLKFARGLNYAGGELQIRKAHLIRWFASMAEDAEIRSESSIRSGEFPHRHTGGSPAE